MSTTDIREAAYAKLLAFTYSPQPPVLWPGKKQTPPDEGIWLQVKLFPNEPFDENWSEGCVDARGFLQIEVHFRPGMGEIEPSELADALIDYFPKELMLGPVRVKKRPWQSPPVEDGDEVFIPITVPYSGLT